MTGDTPPLPAILDMEASGFGRHSYPIEVGYVLPDGRAACTLIRPEPDWLHWDPLAEQVHRIPRDAALHHGRDAREVARWLNDGLQGLTVYTDGWGHDSRPSSRPPAAAATSASTACSRCSTRTSCRAGMR